LVLDFFCFSYSPGPNTWKIMKKKKKFRESLRKILEWKNQFSGFYRFYSIVDIHQKIKIFGMYVKFPKKNKFGKKNIKTKKPPLILYFMTLNFLNDFLKTHFDASLISKYLPNWNLGFRRSSRDQFFQIPFT
jgi:hypothetical protein